MVRGGRALDETRLFSLILVLLGIIMLLPGTGLHVAFMHGPRLERADMKAQGLVHADSHFPVSLTLIVAVLLLAPGIFALGAIAF